jgi:hypothetical protein
MTMKALVVVESVFGNTRAVADAVARGLAHSYEVETVEAGDAPTQLTGIDLLVAGGPTHAFGLTSPASRRSAADQSGGAITEPGPGLREWLTDLEPGAGLACATFDTRMGALWLPGSAAAKAARALRSKGYLTIDRARTFRVGGMRGPLAEGETLRAEKWGADLAARCAARSRRAER